MPHLSPDELDRLVVDGRPLPASRRRHLSDCPACQRERADLEALDATFRALPTRAPSAGFASRVMARVDLPGTAEPVSMPDGRRVAAVLGGLTGGAVAATLALLVGLGLWGPITAGLGRWLAGAATDLALRGARALWATGLPGALEQLAGTFGPLGWASAAASVGLVSALTAFLLVRLLRAPPRLPRASLS